MRIKIRISAMTLLTALVTTAPAQTVEELQDSLHSLSQQLQFTPGSIDLRLRKAALNLQLEQWEYAKEEYDEVLRKEEDNPAALFHRAYVFEKMGRPAFARADYEHLLKVVPGHFEGTLGLALLSEKEHHYTEAMDLLNLLVEMFPNRAEAYAARAGVEKERGMLLLAEHDFGQALELDPENTDYLLNRVDVRLLLGKKNDARHDLDRAVKAGFSKGELMEWYKLCK